MPITKLGNFDQSELNNLINQFEASRIRTRNFAAKLRFWRSGGFLDPQEKLDLVSYCKPSGDTRGKAREVARRISILVFGKVISKLD